MNNTNNTSARQSFDIAKRVLFNSWIPQFIASYGASEGAKRCTDWVENRKLSQSEIRLEVELTTANNIFTFGMTPNQQNSAGVIYKTEQRLQLQDSLVTSEYGIYIGNPADANDSAFRLNTYGNPVLFTTAGSFAAIDETFYFGGKFIMKVNNDVVIPYRGLVNHYYRPQTQQIAAIAAGAVGDQFRGSEDGLITQEPNLLLIGSKNYVPQIEMPSNLAAVTAGERAVLIFKGVLAQNSTVIN